MLVDSESSLTFTKKVETVIDSSSSHVAREEHAELKVSVKSMERLISSVAVTNFLSYDVIHDYNNDNMNLNIPDEECIVDFYDVIDDSVGHSQEVSQAENQDQSPAEMSISSKMSPMLFEHESKDSCICSFFYVYQVKGWLSQRNMISI